MAKSYSYDLRVRVMQQMAAGVAISTISQLFNISRYTLYQWQKLKAQTGDVKARAGYQQGYGHKITHWRNFKKFIKANGDQTLKAMTHLWHEPISMSTLQRALRKINYTRKKRLIITTNATKLYG